LERRRVENKYNLHTSNSWAKIILLYCPDEKEGFERFFQLLEEFQQLRNQEVDADGVEEKETVTI
jgi:lantibiotic modifying enzyme